MKKNAVLVVIVTLLVFIGLLFFIGQKSGQRSKIINEGDRAPEFRLPSLDGRDASLSALRGKVVMVHFWATWCPPCVEEMPTLEQLHRALFGKDFEIMAVSVDEGGASAVSGFLQRNRLTLPVFLNPDRSVAGLYGTFKFPETYIVDREGVVRYKAIGARDWMNPVNIESIRALIDRK